MTLSHAAVIEAFLDHRKATGNHVYTDGKVIYSYGEHFPMGVWRIDNKFVYINSDKYSTSSTSRHQSMLMRDLDGRGIPSKPLPTEKMKATAAYVTRTGPFSLKPAKAEIEQQPPKEKSPKREETLESVIKSWVRRKRVRA